MPLHGRPTQSLSCDNDPHINMFVSRLSEGEARRYLRETADLRPGWRAGRVDMDAARVFVLTCATDAASLASAALNKRKPESLPAQSALVVRQMNADPELVAEFLLHGGEKLRHLVIGGLKQDMEPILLRLPMMCNLAVLALIGIRIENGEAAVLETALSSGNLTCLQLQRNALSARGLLAIARGLANSRITCVQILKNQLDSFRVNSLCAGLHERATSVEGALPLQHLHLDCNPIGAEGAGIIAGALASRNSQWCFLATLRLGYAQLEAAGTTALAAALRSNSSVTVLDMPGNNMCQGGALEMARTFRCNKFLNHVKLNNNNFKDEGMAHFVKHMGHMYLRSLDLSYNQISPAMEKMLSATVHRCPAGNVCTGASSPASDQDAVWHQSSSHVWAQEGLVTLARDDSEDWTAFAMGQHPRLGSSSTVLLLDEPLVHCILQHCVHGSSMELVW